MSLMGGMAGVLLHRNTECDVQTTKFQVQAVTVKEAP